MRKAQITVFVILGILILIIFGFTFYIINTIKTTRNIEVLFEKGSINTYVTNCIKNTGEDAVILLGKQGRIYPEDYLETEDSKIAYLYDKENKVPSKEEVETEINIYINNNLLACLNFELLERKGWKINYKEIQTKTSINENSVSFTINFPVEITQNDATIKLNDFFYLIDNFRLNYILNAINQTVEFQLQYPKKVDMTMLNNFNLDFTILPYDNTIIYIIKDSKSKIMAKDYTFRFANRY